MNFTPRLKTNSLFWLSSLKESELGVTRRVGRRLRERREALMKMAVPTRVELTKQPMAELRLLRDVITKLTEDLIERFRPGFLAGKAPAFTVERLVEEV